MNVTQEFIASQRLRLVVTNECNIACFYCHNEGQTKSTDHMSLALAGALAAALEGTLTDPLATVTFSGGEPLIHPELPNIVDRYRDLSKQLTVVTNGIELDRAMLTRLAHAGVTKVRLGVDSIQQTRSRPTAGVLHVVDAHRIVADVRELGLSLELNTVVTLFNREELPYLFEFALSNGTHAKFFEHVRVNEFASPDHKGLLQRQPLVSHAEFHQAITKTFPDCQYDAAPDFGEANIEYVVDGLELRYCRYLCPFGLCGLSGTRVDALGQIYVCMAQPRLERVRVGMPTGEIIAALRRTSERGCVNAKDAS